VNANILLLEASFLLYLYVFFMSFQEPFPDLLPILLVPLYLDVFNQFLLLNLLHDAGASILIHSKDVRSHYLLNLVGGELINQVPQLHVGLLRLLRIFEGV